jgi:archaellum biogenesis ATPase FlaH
MIVEISELKEIIEIPEQVQFDVILIDPISTVIRSITDYLNDKGMITLIRHLDRNRDKMVLLTVKAKRDIVDILRGQLADPVGAFREGLHETLEDLNDNKRFKARIRQMMPDGMSTQVYITFWKVEIGYNGKDDIEIISVQE